MGSVGGQSSSAALVRDTLVPGIECYGTRYRCIIALRHRRPPRAHIQGLDHRKPEKGATARKGLSFFTAVCVYTSFHHISIFWAPVDTLQVWKWVHSHKPGSHRGKVPHTEGILCFVCLPCVSYGARPSCFTALHLEKGSTVTYPRRLSSRMCSTRSFSTPKNLCEKSPRSCDFTGILTHGGSEIAY